MPRPKKDKSDPSAQLLSEDHTSSGSHHRPNLILSDSEDSDSGDTQEYHSAVELPDGEDGPKLRINKEYARRFEHNKKREELHRLQEKYGKQGLEEEEEELDSDSEEEDDTAVLATERLDQEIAATIEAIRKKDPKIYDGKTAFFSAIEEEEKENGSDGIETGKEKPIFLKDYHRKNLLSGTVGDEDAPQTYLEEQEDLKRTVVLEMHQAAEDELDSDADDADAGFLVRKTQPEKLEPVVDIPDPATADPSNPEEYLTRFFQSRAWTKPSGFAPLEDDDSEEEDRVEEFEKAYNFRFEDPDANARGKLITYGRDAISANTVRREEISGRKKAREKKREKQQAEKELQEKEKGRLRKLKTEELIEKFKMIREAAGLDGGRDDEEVETEVLNSLLEGDWSDEQWEEWMSKKFGNSYYEADVGKIKKPKFDDEIDIGDIASDLEDDAKPDLEDEKVGKDTQTARKSKDRKSFQKEERKKRQKEKDLKRKLGQYVEENYDFEDQIPSKSLKTTFRYRETTPESYGLTSLDILAAEDADLNSFVGLKKLAAFREPEKKKRDKKRYGKKKRLRDWRKETFGDEEGVKMPADWKPTGVTEERESNVDIRGEGGERKRKRRRKENKS
ncbi:Krr1-domain-containing protein [Choiromyces venosus 120613-1]|uniref:Krr1-domain-containing protein n=1 Tax=Choiromyces venosus 120613-1 TaxID=1336337 RepID=A0A3N4JLG4_9PEZI|nr:Krr1-domain-containing protein [Choiromyces venosus 120613-1]